MGESSGPLAEDIRKSPCNQSAETLYVQAMDYGCDVSSLEFAQRMDQDDSLRHFRQMFYYPKSATLPNACPDVLEDPDEDCVYFNGNSLGLLSKRVRERICREMNKWAQMAELGRLEGEFPWAYCSEYCEETLAHIVGAQPGEVSVMNSLTVNLHLLMMSFYRPTPDRHKILLECGAFPSDHYAIESQIRQRGHDPTHSMILLDVKQGEEYIRHEDIIEVIKKEGASIALILLPGVQYRTGQLLDIQGITQAAHAQGCHVGFDLAHAVANVELSLHDWKVDFAVWCSYKYLNCEHGSIGGAFLHSMHARNSYPRLCGWWGHKMDTRFVMDNKIDLYEGACGYKLSTAPMLSCTALQASLEIISEATMPKLRQKSKALTAYLELLLLRYFGQRQQTKDRVAEVYDHVEILTPADPEQRGCQLSIRVSGPIGPIHSELTKRGVVADTRTPNILRVAPVPLYNSFCDVYRFIQKLGQAFQAANATNDVIDTSGSQRQQ